MKIAKITPQTNLKLSSDRKQTGNKISFNGLTGVTTEIVKTFEVNKVMANGKIKFFIKDFFENGVLVKRTTVNYAMDGLLKSIEMKEFIDKIYSKLTKIKFGVEGKIADKITEFDKNRIPYKIVRTIFKNGKPVSLEPTFLVSVK